LNTYQEKNFPHILQIFTILLETEETFRGLIGTICITYPDVSIMKRCSESKGSGCGVKSVNLNIFELYLEDLMADGCVVGTVVPIIIGNLEGK
jgi:hypothetical protein